jgi:SPP1 family predicted phage head-tail adaptor
MKAGDLRTQVTFLAAPTARNPFNERSTVTDYTTWTPVVSVWAALKPLSGRLLTLAQASTVTAIASHSLTIRYNASVAVTNAVKIGGAPAVPNVPVTWDTLTGDDWSDLQADATGGESESSEDVTPPARYLRIVGGPLDENNRHRMQTFLVTEVVA